MSTTTLQAARSLLAGSAPKSGHALDLPDIHDDWDWIYEDVTPDSPSSSRKRKATDAFEAPAQRRIVGARSADFEVRIGDAIRLKADRNETWVALIRDFVEDEEGDEKMASFMWFTSGQEIRNKAKRRNDQLPNEIYITTNFDENPLDTIEGKATVISAQQYRDLYPTGKIPRTSDDHGRMFVCRRGCSARTATYTDEFVWEDVYQGVEDMNELKERVAAETKATRKKKVEAKSKDLDFVVADDVDNEFEPRTPSKKRKFEQATTPRSERKGQTPRKFTTPTHRRIITKKALEFTPLGTRILSPAHITSPFQVARSQLHVAAVPTALPCREEQFAEVYNYLESAITAGTGSCIYISGTPGTGKTATVREVIASLSGAVEAEELDDFIFVEINGMKVTDPHQSYSLLWEALTGDRLSPTHALGLLEREFSNPSPRRVPCVVLMDELDQLVTKTQSVMYNFFNWPGLRHSRLIVLAVANTMDLPERTLSNKISSRLGLTRITFPGYTHDQLIQIISSRLANVPGKLVDPDAIQFASRKVAQVSGDARRALDICRRAVEIAEQEANVAVTSLTPAALKSGVRHVSTLETIPGSDDEEDGDANDDDADADDADIEPPDSPSKRTSLRAPTLSTPHSPSTLLTRTPARRPIPAAPTTFTKPHVTIATIQRAIREATTSPLQLYLRHLPLASKLFLAALVARARRSGVAECVVGDVVDEAGRLARMSSVGAVGGLVGGGVSHSGGGGGGVDGQSLAVEGDAGGAGGGRRTRFTGGNGGGSDITGSTRTKSTRIQAMGAAVAELSEGGVVVLEARGAMGSAGGVGQRMAKVRLNVGEEEVRLAFRGDEECSGLGFAGS